METNYLLSGLLLGLSAGLAPGPLLALVVSESLRHGSRAGARVALAPLLTDPPIILLTLLMVHGLSRFQPALAIISGLGGLVLLRLGYESLQTRGLGPEPGHRPPASNSLGKGVLVNLLSPHPWLFWFSVGAPLLLKAAAAGRATAIGFVVIFYLLLVGCKLLLARLVGRYRALLAGPAYLWTMRLLGIMLIFFAFIFFREGYVLLRG